MPRDASGTYTTPAGQPVTSGTVISAAVFNALVNDLKAEMTDSLSRSGKGGMLVPMPFADGTEAAPGISFLNETSTGFQRIGANDLGLSIGGNRKYEFNLGFLKLSSVAIHQADTNTALTLRGNVAAADAGSDIIFDSQATRSNGSLVTVKNNNAVKFTLDFNGEPSVQGGFACGAGFLSSDTTVTAAMTTLTGLSFTSVVSATYIAEVLVMTSSGGAAGITCEWTGPASVTSARFQTLVTANNSGAPITGGDAISGLATATTNVAIAGASAAAVTSTLILTTDGVNSGVVQFKMASGTTNSTAYKGSYIRWRRLA